ncbi:MAG: DUF4286 family protein [Gammaproteobacteria bacterium]
MSTTAAVPAVSPGPLAGGELIYEVTLEVRRRSARRFDAWLKGHMREMCALPGFLGAALVSPGEIPATSDAGKVRRVVRYRLADYAALENYLSEHAQRMRAESLRHFGKQLQSRRRLLDAAGTELLADAALPAAIMRCLNCHTPLMGKYCAECGQPNHTYAAPLRTVFNDFLGHHAGSDNKFSRSIGPLWFKPGYLSREYSAGRRVRYISPLRLYLYSSLLFFLVAWGMAPSQFFHVNGQAASTGTPAAAKTLTARERQEIRANPYLTAKEKGELLNPGRNQESTWESGQASTAGNVQTKVFVAPSAAPNITLTTSGNSDNDVHGTILGRSFSMPRTELETRFQHALETDLPKLLFLFLPLVALLLKIFYLRSRRYYMEHLIFTLHNHAFLFQAILVMLLVHLLGQHVGWLALPAHWLNVVIGWYIAVYVFLAMWFYYRQSFIKTLGKYLLVGGIYWIALFSVFVIGALLVFFYTVAA